VFPDNNVQTSTIFVCIAFDILSSCCFLLSVLRWYAQISYEPLKTMSDVAYSSSFSLPPLQLLAGRIQFSILPPSCLIITRIISGRKSTCNYLSIWFLPTLYCRILSALILSQITSRLPADEWGIARQIQHRPRSEHYLPDILVSLWNRYLWSTMPSSSVSTRYQSSPSA